MEKPSEINGDVLLEIGKRIRAYKDLVVFRGVCALWHRVGAAVVRLNFDRVPGFPWLMLPPEKGNKQLSFWSTSPKIETRLVSLPESLWSNNCFSSKGCLITVDPSWNISLVNPFLSPNSGIDREIKLPDIRKFSDWNDEMGDDLRHEVFFTKCALSSSSPHTTPDYKLVVVYGSRGKLAYFKPGNTVWTTIDTSRGRFSDIVYNEYDDKFYGIQCCGSLFVCDLSVDPAVSREIARLPVEVLAVDFLWGQLYVVPSSAQGTVYVIRRNGGTLYYVDETETDETYLTSFFEVFRVNLNNNEWVKIHDIGNTSFFIGHATTFSLQIVDHLSLSLKPNCIYFTDDGSEPYSSLPEGGGRDTGIYNIQDDSFIQHSWGYSWFDRLNPPMWIETVLC